MVKLIDFRYQAGSATTPVLEIMVFPDSDGHVWATLEIYSSKTGRFIPEEYPDPMEPSFAYLEAIAYAETHQISFICVRDPRGLFPKLTKSQTPQGDPDR